ncbi:MAG: efflux RND transporter periplasmic adaptor subunit [Devosia sp.]|jgi:membrane fusion protein (multidrug efflux system)|uniref:efflux RND transporter periplasmic adaptor subunit n=1 Tax=unclassified Devosia TaxID=196773 RepID=UPI0019F2F408|nr:MULTISPECIES: efflux RND transporter periplasmic adaptor subunit [unclassified Devosia]MBF0680706.1 efflux RND transporter periplasmic adaptor subunit [Devosia sp.]WEJ32050.1 efflux RND transporter periplasmic adaptor subunit [Devosia sp. SD17-2]
MTATNDKPEWAQSKREKANALRVAQGLKPKRRIGPWIVLGVLVIGAGAFMFLQPPAPEPVAAVEETAVVKQILRSETAEIAPMTLRQTVKVTGSLVPGHLSSIASQASGRVLSVLVSPGDTVEEGAVLAEIDRATLELQLNQQRATAEATRIQLANSRQQLERTEELARQGLTSPSNLEAARSSTAALESNLAALENGVSGAEIALANATVRSPLSGVVSVRSVEPGQTISAGTPLFTVVNLDEMEFQASASVNSSALVKSGQKVDVTVNGVDGQTFEGEVVRVNPVATTGTRTVPMYIAIDNVDGMLRGGMFAVGNVTVVEKTEAIAIPTTAVREDAEGQYVLALNDGTLERKAVELGAQWDRGRTVEVTGVAVGETVIAGALSELSAGDAYEIVGN